MSNGKLSIGFGKAAPTNMELLMAKAKGPAKKTGAALFADDDEDDDGNRGGAAAAGSSASGSRAGPSNSRRPPALNAPAPLSSGSAGPSRNAALGRATQRAQAEALAIDSTVFDYDGVYDTLKAAERARDEAKKAESADRKPKYIEAFLASAQTRKLDKLRAEEKMLQREREKEGDEFADKESFATEAYKRQMEEVRKAEEEEKKREEEMRKQRKGPGLSAFYKQMLDSSEADHHAAVASASTGPSLSIRPPTAAGSSSLYEPEAEYDPLLAREAAAAATTVSNAPPGAIDPNRDVEVNDEGEVVDKRSLLKAGLNIIKKPQTAVPNSLTGGQRSGAVLEGPYKSRAVGSAASYQERVERERKRLAQQVKEDAERKRREHEAKMAKEEEEARKRREGDDGEAERRRKEARERFLARKRGRVDGPTDGSDASEQNKKVKEAA